MFSRYENNKVVKGVLNSGFNKNQEGKTTFSESGKNPYGVYIDLDHIQVFESNEIHAITYKVDIEGMSTESEDGKIKEIFNLVYFSTNKVDYYVTLFRYDFSRIPLDHFIKNPQETDNLLTFVPLKDIENIYENIHSSIFNGLAGKGGPSLYLSFQSDDCSETTIVAGTTCKGDGNPKHNYGEPCGMTNPNDRATPGFSYTTYSPCGGGYRGGGSGGGSVGSPGHGGGGGGSTPAQPIKANPIKLPGDFVKYPGGRFSQIDLGNTNNNSKILKNLVENNKVSLKDLYDKRNEQREHGYRFSKAKIAGEMKVTSPIALPLATLYSLSTKVLRTNHSIIGYTHTHGNTSVMQDGNQVFPMFTHSDIMALFDMVNKNPTIDKNPSDLFAGLMVNACFYVIMLPNDVTHENVATKYSNFATMNGTKMTANKEAQAWTDMMKKLSSRYKVIAKNGTNKDIQYEKALLLTLKEFNLNVKVYKLPDDNGQFNTKWRELKLPANSQKMSDNTQPIETILN